MGLGDKTKECFSNLAVGNPRVWQGHPPQQSPPPYPQPSNEDFILHIAFLCKMSADERVLVPNEV